MIIFSLTIFVSDIIVSYGCWEKHKTCIIHSKLETIHYTNVCMVPLAITTTGANFCYKFMFPRKALQQGKWNKHWNEQTWNGRNTHIVLHLISVKIQLSLHSFVVEISFIFQNVMWSRKRFYKKWIQNLNIFFFLSSWWVVI